MIRCFIIFFQASFWIANLFGSSNPLPDNFIKALNEKFSAQEKNYTVRINKDPFNVSFYSARGDARMFLGSYSGARDDYEKMILLEPKLEISHWRLGIVYFYLGDFKKAANQFKIYHEYDSVDRENGIWRFMSQFKEDGLDSARDQLLKYNQNDRPPYPWLYEMFAGKCKPEDIFRRIDEMEFAKDYKARVLFHAHLYVGIYLELTGDNASEALDHLALAVANEYGRSTGTYMWQVARLHHSRLVDSQSRLR
jgi:lipoprotein NlpI